MTDNATSPRLNGQKQKTRSNSGAGHGSQRRLVGRCPSAVMARAASSVMSCAPEHRRETVSRATPSRRATSVIEPMDSTIDLYSGAVMSSGAVCVNLVKDQLGGDAGHHVNVALAGGIQHLDRDSKGFRSVSRDAAVKGLRVHRADAPASLDSGGLGRSHRRRQLRVAAAKTWAVARDHGSSDNVRLRECPSAGYLSHCVGDGPHLREAVGYNGTGAVHLCHLGPKTVVAPLELAAVLFGEDQTLIEKILLLVAVGEAGDFSLSKGRGNRGHGMVGSGGLVRGSRRAHRQRSQCDLKSRTSQDLFVIFYHGRDFSRSANDQEEARRK